MKVEERTIQLINNLSNYALFLFWNEIEKWVGISKYIDANITISERQYACLKKLYDFSQYPMPKCRIKEEPQL